MFSYNQGYLFVRNILLFKCILKRVFNNCYGLSRLWYGLKSKIKPARRIDSCHIIIVCKVSSIGDLTLTIIEPLHGYYFVTLPHEMRI